jgi:hypothetical protein
MSDGPTLIDGSDYPMTVVGAHGQIVLNRREVRMAAFGMETQEVWQATTLADALAFQVTLLADERVADFRLVQDAGEPFHIEVLWCYDRNNAIWKVGEDKPLWNVGLVETSMPLELAPYFLGRATDDASIGDLQTYIPKIDQWMAVGGSFALPTTAAAKKILQRYAGLRIAGVQDYSPNVVTLVERFRLFSSQTGDVTGTAQSYKYLLQAIGMTQTLTKINPPADILAAVANMSVLAFPEDASLTPYFPEPVLTWVRQKPEVALTGNNPLGPRDVTLKWFGYQNVAAVLYPPSLGENTGQFDPQKTTPFT